MEDIFINFNIKFGLEKVWRWKLWIAILCIICSVGAFLWSSRLAPEFKSTSAFIPPSINSLYSLTYNQGIAYRGFEAAEEEDIDRVVDYLTSIPVMDSMARAFHLYEHYGIVWGTPNADKTYYHVYQGKNRVSFSSRSVVQIECYDTSPDTASLIANKYLQFAADFFENVSRRKEGLTACNQIIDSLRKQRHVVLDSLAWMRSEHKLFHIDNVGDNLSSVLASRLQSDPDFARLYDRMYSLELQLNVLEERIGEMENEEVSRRQYIEQYPSLIRVTQEARPSTFKARPKRSIYVAFALLGSFVFGSFMAILLDRKKDRLPI